jgi:hypothetical protein
MEAVGLVLEMGLQGKGAVPPLGHVEAGMSGTG